MLRRRRRFIPVLLLSTAALVTGMLAPVFAGVDTALAASGKPSLDLCVVEPGFATPGDTFAITTTGPQNFQDTAQLKASACGSYKQLPISGTFTVTQSQTAAGWQLAQIYCYSVGTADKANGTVDLSSSSATIKVTGPVSCIFAELPGSGGGGFSGGSGSSGKTTTTTAKGTTTTKAPPGTIKPPLTIVNICQINPKLCVFKGP